MFKYVKYCLSGILCLTLFNASAQTVTSPDKKIVVNFALSNGSPSYTVSYNKQQVLLPSALGLETSNAAFAGNLTLANASAVTPVTDTYKSANAKKSTITYKANKRVFNLINAKKQKLQVIFQVSNDGVAFRYHLPDSQPEGTLVNKELTSYQFDKTATSFLQPKAIAQTGFEHTNPSYEENYRQNVPVGGQSNNGWVYPALFKAGDTWLLITEAGMDGSYCGTSLINDAGSPVYRINFPDPREVFTGKGHLPVNVKSTPWRVITIGSLKTIVESTLGTDVAIPEIKLADKSFVKPGKSSWSWIMSKDDSITFTEQLRYIKLADKMKWQYCLIDADWDTRIGYDKVKQLVDSAAAKNIGILVWYNSAGSWNTVKMHPKDVLTTAESRDKEFARLQSMGVKGIKVDFFGGDGQSMIQYYIDILNSAAKYKLLVNFHGATLPRGWARTYPHLMTTEAVKGFEMVTFSQGDANRQANHCAMLPFTRNAFDPMDFTPMNLYKIPTSVQRKTSSGFELATSVLFLSGIQHYAESPAGMAQVPDYVVSYLQQLPNNWDDVRFIDGFPGKHAVIARKGNGKWYVAGINGENTEKKLSIDLSAFKNANATLITDGAEPLTFSQNKMTISADGKTEVTMKPNGGFVLLIN